MPRHNGHYCDCCNHHLSEDDFTHYGSWSYDCPECGFGYRHADRRDVSKQVADFLEQQEELDDIYDENIEEDEEDENE